MTDRIVDKWHSPELKPLPKYVHGEFRTMARRAERLKREIERLTELENQEIDVSPFYDVHRNEKYFNKWWQHNLDQGIFVENNKRNPPDFYSVAWQSCWPEEAPTMIFQFFHEYLDVRFKWFAGAKWGRDNKYEDTEIVLQRVDPRILNGALPNVNGCYYTCAGDYAFPFHDEKLSRVGKMNELYNYTSSPNLRENREVTDAYNMVAITFQYCDVEVKRGNIIETTTIADLWMELADHLKNGVGLEEQDLLIKTREQICYSCKNCQPEFCDTSALYDEAGKRILTRYRKLLNLVGVNHRAELKEILALSEKTQDRLIRGKGVSSRCLCCAINTDNDKRIVKEVKKQFSKEWKARLKAQEAVVVGQGNPFATVTTGGRVDTTINQNDIDPNIQF